MTDCEQDVFLKYGSVSIHNSTMAIIVMVTEVKATKRADLEDFGYSKRFQKSFFKPEELSTISSSSSSSSP